MSFLSPFHEIIHVCEACEGQIMVTLDYITIFSADHLLQKSFALN